MLSRLQDVAEQPGSLFRGHTVVRICATIETPTGSVAALAFKNQLLVKWEVVASGKHLFLLRPWTIVGCKVGQR